MTRYNFCLNSMNGLTNQQTRSEREQERANGYSATVRSIAIGETTASIHLRQ